MTERSGIVSPHSEGSQTERRPSMWWRIAIMFTAVTLLWLGAGAFAEVIFGTEYSRAAHVLRTILIAVVAVPLVIVARRLLDRRSWAGMRLGSLRSGWKPLLVGITCWLIPATIGAAASLMLGWTEIRVSESVNDVLLFSLSLPLLVFFYEALPEELIFRGYFYTNLAARMPLRMAIFGQAVLFTLWGILNGGENSVDRSVLFFSFAIIAGVFRAISGSIWAGIGFHLAFQTFAQLFGSVGNQFNISSPAILMVVAFGILPFAFGPIILRWFYKQRPNWSAPEPDAQTLVKEGKR